ncbi:MAG: ATP-binding protein, partial [bacterium]
FLISNILDIDSKKIYNILLVFTEFSTNMLKHARGGIFLVYIISDGIYMVFNDAGEGIDIEKIPYIALSNYSTAEDSLGFGFSICIHLCNSIGIATDKKGTSILVFFEK